MGDRRWGDGRYQGVSLLGRGGSAEVWHATDRVLRRAVAVKAFLCDGAPCEGARSEGALPGGPLVAAAADGRPESPTEAAGRFEREVHGHASLRHRHIVPVWDAGITDSTPWCVLQLARGGNLAAPRVTIDRAGLARIAAGVADALAYLHDRAIVHRDVKPANILLGDHGHALLSDFGIARWADPARLTRTGQLIGTAAFLSPEQVRGEAVTGAADVYALGLVLLEQLTGRREYPGGAVEAAIARLNRRPVVPVALGPDWVRLLTSMTDQDPARRPDAGAAQAALARIAQAGLAGSAPGATAPTFAVPVEPVAAAVPIGPVRTAVVPARGAGSATTPIATPGPHRVSAVRRLSDRGVLRRGVATAAAVALGVVLGAVGATHALSARNLSAAPPAATTSRPAAARTSRPGPRRPAPVSAVPATSSVAGPLRVLSGDPDSDLGVAGSSTHAPAPSGGRQALIPTTPPSPSPTSGPTGSPTPSPSAADHPAGGLPSGSGEPTGAPSSSTGAPSGAGGTSSGAPSSSGPQPAGQPTDPGGQQVAPAVQTPAAGSEVSVTGLPA